MEKIIGKFQGGDNFGFLIPKNREYYGGDFFVSKKHFGGAQNGDMVEGVEIKSKGKKPEAKIIKVFGDGKNPENEVYVEGIFSKENDDFGFIDIEGQKKGFFVYGNKKWDAEDGDRVKAKIVDYKGKKEAQIVKVFKSEFENIEGIYKDNDTFGFVLTEEEGDIFIPGTKKGGAQDGDKVCVKIVKMGKKNKEGLILSIKK